jgi:hypothetical protein
VLPVLLAATFAVAACGGGESTAAPSATDSAGSAVSSPGSAASSPGSSAAPGAGSAASSGSPAGSGSSANQRRRPAAAAGGACRLLTFEAVERTLGTAFDVAAASGPAGATQTCVLQKIGATAPDLLLSVTPARGVTAKTYRESYVPSGGAALSAPGEAAYRRVVRGGTSGGPRVEVGWLSRSGRVLTLAYTLARQDDATHTAQLVEQLVALGERVDRTG